MTLSQKWLLGTSVVSTLVIEAITVVSRIALATSAAELDNANLPLLLKMHHMFWSIPLFIAAGFMSRNAKRRAAIVGLATGLVLSDLIHHFLVLPLWKGNTGWHWP